MRIDEDAAKCRIIWVILLILRHVEDTLTNGVHHRAVGFGRWHSFQILRSGRAIQWKMKIRWEIGAECKGKPLASSRSVGAIYRDRVVERP
jgi:hypothetical protein